MGLVISSILEINPETERKCWLYLLDYGLESSVSEAIRRNFVHFAERSSEAGTVIVLSTNRHVQNELLSWHSVFGLPGDRHLPALLVSTINPRQLLDGDPQWFALGGHRAVLIPLSRGLSVEEALMKVEEVFDAALNDNLNDLFDKVNGETGRESKPILLLQPNISGVGLDLNALYQKFRPRN